MMMMMMMMMNGDAKLTRGRKKFAIFYRYLYISVNVT